MSQLHSYDHHSYHFVTSLEINRYQCSNIFPPFWVFPVPTPFNTEVVPFHPTYSILSMVAVFIPAAIGNWVSDVVGISRMR